MFVGIETPEADALDGHPEGPQQRRPDDGIHQGAEPLMGWKSPPALSLDWTPTARTPSSGSRISSTFRKIPMLDHQPVCRRCRKNAAVGIGSSATGGLLDDDFAREQWWCFLRPAMKRSSACGAARSPMRTIRKKTVTRAFPPSSRGDLRQSQGHAGQGQAHLAQTCAAGAVMAWARAALTSACCRIFPQTVLAHGQSMRLSTGKIDGLTGARRSMGYHLIQFTREALRRRPERVILLDQRSAPSRWRPPSRRSVGRKMKKSRVAA